MSNERSGMSGAVENRRIELGAVKPVIVTRIVEAISATIAGVVSVLVTNVVNIAFGGVVPQLDDTDKQAVSLYGEGAGAPGDTALQVATEDSAHQTNGLHMMAKYEATPDTVEDGDAVVPQADREGHLRNASLARMASTANTHTPGADTDAVVTRAAAGAGVWWEWGGVYWGYSEDPTGGSLVIEDGAGNTVVEVPITKGGPGFLPFTPPMRGTANRALVVTLAAGGGTCVGSVNPHAWTAQ